MECDALLEVTHGRERENLEHVLQDNGDRNIQELAWSSSRSRTGESKGGAAGMGGWVAGLEGKEEVQE